jgi:hypothetical protein
MPEPFVSAQEAAKFVGISRRFLTELARRGIAGAYPIGTGELRKTWVFFGYTHLGASSAYIVGPAGGGS